MQGIMAYDGDSPQPVDPRGGPGPADAGALHHHDRQDHTDRSQPVMHHQDHQDHHTSLGTHPGSQRDGPRRQGQHKELPQRTTGDEAGPARRSMENPGEVPPRRMAMDERTPQKARLNTSHLSGLGGSPFFQHNEEQAHARELERAQGADVNIEGEASTARDSFSRWMESQDTAEVGRDRYRGRSPPSDDQRPIVPQPLRLDGRQERPHHLGPDHSSPYASSRGGTEPKGPNGRDSGRSDSGRKDNDRDSAPSPEFEEHGSVAMLGRLHVDPTTFTTEPSGPASSTSARKSTESRGVDEGRGGLQPIVLRRRGGPPTAGDSDHEDDPGGEHRLDDQQEHHASRMPREGGDHSIYDVDLPPSDRATIAVVPVSYLCSFTVATAAVVAHVYVVSERSHNDVDDGRPPRTDRGVDHGKGSGLGASHHPLSRTESGHPQKRLVLVLDPCENVAAERQDVLQERAHRAMAGHDEVAGGAVELDLSVAASRCVKFSMVEELALSEHDLASLAAALTDYDVIVQQSTATDFIRTFPALFDPRSNPLPTFLPSGDGRPLLRRLRCDRAAVGALRGGDDCVDGPHSNDSEGRGAQRSISSTAERHRSSEPRRGSSSHLHQRGHRGPGPDDDDAETSALVQLREELRKAKADHDAETAALREVIASQKQDAVMEGVRLQTELEAVRRELRLSEELVLATQRRAREDKEELLMRLAMVDRDRNVAIGAERVMAEPRPSTGTEADLKRKKPAPYLEGARSPSPEKAPSKPEEKLGVPAPSEAPNPAATPQDPQHGLVRSANTSTIITEPLDESVDYQPMDRPLSDAFRPSAPTIAETVQHRGAVPFRTQPPTKPTGEPPRSDNVSSTQQTADHVYGSLNSQGQGSRPEPAMQRLPASGVGAALRSYPAAYDPRHTTTSDVSVFTSRRPDEAPVHAQQGRNQASRQTLDAFEERAHRRFHNDGGIRPTDTHGALPVVSHAAATASHSHRPQGEFTAPRAAQRYPSPIISRGEQGKVPQRSVFGGGAAGVPLGIAASPSLAFSRPAHAQHSQTTALGTAQPQRHHGAHTQQPHHQQQQPQKQDPLEALQRQLREGERFLMDFNRTH